MQYHVETVINAEDQPISYRLTKDGEPVSEVNDYLAYLTCLNFSMNTIRAYAYDLKNFYTWMSQHLAQPDFLSVSRTDFLSYIDWQKASDMHSSGKTAGGYSPATISRRLKALTGFYEHSLLMRNLPLEKSPILPKRTRLSSFTYSGSKGELSHLQRKSQHTSRMQVKVPKRLPTVLSQEEVETALANLGTYRDKVFFLLMLCGGLRASEVLSLSWSDMDVAKKQLRVHGKGRKERIIPVDPVFWKMLDRYLRYEYPNNAQIDKIFIVLKGKKRGQPLAYHGLYKIFRTLAKALDNKRLKPHNLRHTCATHLAENGVPVDVIQKMLGHEQIDSSMVYIHLSNTKLHDIYTASLRKRPFVSGKDEVKN